MNEPAIKTIRLPLPFRMGWVNCYLLVAGASFVLIDTGGSNNRQALLKELDGAGCQAGLLKWIVLTHGDFDHTGNAAFLHSTFGCPVAMHKDDAGMVARGDMFVNRNPPNRLIRTLIPLFTGFGKAERFTPDRLVEDGEDLSADGLEAKILSIPGHSKGSIGILTASGDLFCGDLLDNTKEPALNSLIDDVNAADASLQRLRRLRIGTVYPGHGQSFPMRIFGETG